MIFRDHELATREASAKAAQALARLVHLAETGASGQTPRVARFVASLYDPDKFPIDLLALRTVDVEISDDVLLCIDALRWGGADLHKLIPDGAARMEAVVASWGIA